MAREPAKAAQLPVPASIPRRWSLSPPSDSFCFRAGRRRLSPGRSARSAAEAAAVAQAAVRAPAAAAAAEEAAAAAAAADRERNAAFGRRPELSFELSRAAV